MDLEAFYEERIDELTQEVEKVKQEKYERERYLVKIINSQKINTIPIATLDLSAHNART